MVKTVTAEFDDHGRATVGIGGAVAGSCLLSFGFTADRSLWILAANTLWFSAGSVVFALPLGTLLAVILYRTEAFGRRWAEVLLLGLLFLPVYFQAAAWSASLGQVPGQTVVGRLTGSPAAGRWLVAVGIQALAATPWVVLILRCGMQLVEPELEELASLDGRWSQVVWSVTLRRCRPAWLVAAWWVAMTAAGDMTVSNLYQLRTLAEEVYTGYALGEGAWNRGTLSIGLLVGMLAGASWAVIGPALVAATHVPRTRAGRFQRSLRPRGRAARAASTAGLWLGVGLLLGLPLVMLAAKAGQTLAYDGQHVVRTWSAGGCLHAVVPTPWNWQQTALGRFGEDFAWSALIGSLTASSSLLVAGGIVWQARRKRRGALTGATLAIGLLAVPGPLIAQWVIAAFSATSSAMAGWLFDRTLAAPVLAESLRVVGIVTLLLWVALPPETTLLYEAALVDGAGPWRRFWHAAIRSHLSGWCLAWIVGFLVAATDLATTILVVPPGVTTITMRLFDFIHAGSLNEVGAIGLTLLGLVGLCGAAIGLWETGRAESFRAVDRSGRAKAE